VSAGSSRGAAWEAIKPVVWERDGWICGYCGNWLERKHPDASHDATVDHIVAKENGGTDQLENLISACRRCNGIKSDRVVTRMPWFNPRWLEALP
jgi:5-methylcytosine-specific restriction endonuclease McrA